MTLTFTCDLGFTLDGVSIATCQTDGSGWDNTTLHCGNIPGLISFTYR